VKKFLSVGKIKVFMTDFTTKLVPDNECNTDLCRELIENINKSRSTIDVAFYGYSRVPEIEKAFIRALNRGVKIRLVYDSDSKGCNIYPDTAIMLDIIKDNISDISSKESYSTMHNKFYIFDDKYLITGSANLSNTDMSEYNSNIVLSIESEKLAKIYKKEFEQMFDGKFHNTKESFVKENILIDESELQVLFSPKDKGIEKEIIPLINNAKQYIYIPTFVLTHKKVTDALIIAKNRGIDVKLIMDALSVSTKHSKINDLRAAGVEVKTENYAGKMHSKSMFIDDKYSIIGSMNFSNSGENKNDENFLVIKNDKIAKVGKEFFLYQWEKIDNKWLKQNPRVEGIDSIGSCYDGIDNDYDELIDKAEDACKI
jgi:phosphatidylserine/phosphatidylglycerophosphate/cardiolipin synthase-like enzyme